MITTTCALCDLSPARPWPAAWWRLLCGNWASCGRPSQSYVQRSRSRSPEGKEHTDKCNHTHIRLCLITFGLNCLSLLHFRIYQKNLLIPWITKNSFWHLPQKERWGDLAIFPPNWTKLQPCQVEWEVMSVLMCGCQQINRIRSALFKLRASVCGSHPFDLADEGVYEVFDLQGFGWEQDQLLIGQVELQHVLWRDGYKQDVCVAGKAQRDLIYDVFQHFPGIWWI